jgi:hypothetical protein
MKIGDVAAAFDRTRQTIRNWTDNPELAEFFSEQARRETGKGYSEFLANDLEVCNSIHILLEEKATWGDIAAKLRSGWRDTNFPDRLLFLASGDDVPENSARLMASRAIAEQKSSDLMEVIHERDARIAELQAKIDAGYVEREKLLREIGQLREEKAAALSRLEAKIELYEEGRLKPLKKPRNSNAV